MRIEDIPEENRPMERFKKLGAVALSDAELLAIILQKGTRGENVVDMCNRLISTYGINNLSDLSLNELQKIKGISPAKAMQIKSLFEFSKRPDLSRNKGKPIKSGKDIFEYATQRLAGNDKEYFMILHLNSKNRVIKDEVVSIGTLNASLIHPREVFKSAIKESANSIILVHNHPSGDPAPSEEDEEITEKLFDAGDLLDIKVFDPVIIGSNNHYSFREDRKF